jgi:plasmid stabilization system protein ParE
MNAQSDSVFGDSTPAPITTDFIALLRDVFDFAVDALAADAQAAQEMQRTKQLSDATEAAIARAEALAAQVLRPLEHEDLGNAESLTGRCAAKIRYGTVEVVRAEAEAGRAAVAASRARASQAAATAHAACDKALETLLLRQEVPGTIAAMTLALDGANQYQARLQGHTLYGLSWKVALEIPSSHPFASVARLDQIVDRFEVDAPEQAGWLHKEVKIRPLRFDRYHLAELSLALVDTTVKLRVAADGLGPGVDLTFAHDSATVRLVRILDSGSIPDEPYEVPVEDSPGELVLRRRIGDNLREEAFVTIAELEKKLEPLPPALRAAFEPLDLWPTTALRASMRNEAHGPLPPTPSAQPAARPNPATAVPRPSETAPFPLLQNEPKVIVAGSDCS